MPHPVGRRRSDELIAGGASPPRSATLTARLSQLGCRRPCGRASWIRRAGVQASLRVRYPDTRPPVLARRPRYRGRPPQGPRQMSALGLSAPERRDRPATSLPCCSGRHSPFRHPGGRPLPLRQIDDGDPTAVVNVRYRPESMTRTGLLCALAGPDSRPFGRRGVDSTLRVLAADRQQRDGSPAKPRRDGTR